MKILFLGDVVAKSGRNIVVNRLPSLKKECGADMVIVNGENSAHGKGITTKIYHSLMNAGADVVTLGNHAFSKSEIKMHMDECPRLVRPFNLEPIDLGQSYYIHECCGMKIAVVNILGEIFMDCCTESPIPVMERALKEIDADMIFVDFHAEATSEKELFLRVFADKLIAVVGTHTHVQTADEKIYHGCAFISDVGMCGPYDSILGRSVDEVLAKSVYKEETHFTPADGAAILCGCLIEIDDKTHRAISIKRIQERPY